MPALLSFDCEFTHPSPRVGAIMQFGAVCVPFDPEKLVMLRHDTPGLTFKFTFPVKADSETTITDWVQKNQADLLKKCSAIPSDQYAGGRHKLIDFLKRCKETYGEPIIPAGWCLGSDMAYLLDLLADENELVHYSAVDLKGLVIGLFGTYDPGDKEVAKALGIGPPTNEHDALADAEYQLKLILGAYKKVREKFA